MAGTSAGHPRLTLCKQDVPAGSSTRGRGWPGQARPRRPGESGRLETALAATDIRDPGSRPGFEAGFARVIADPLGDQQLAGTLPFLWMHVMLRGVRKILSEK